MNPLKKAFIIAAAALFALPASALSSNDLIYHDARAFPLLGKAPDSTEVYFCRLPDSLKTKIRSDLWALGEDPAGMAIRFATDASAIGVKWKNKMAFRMNHMTPTGIRGFDIYTLQEDSTWTFFSSVRPNVNRKNTQTMVMQHMEPKMREYIMFCPLYDGCDSVYIGIDSAATIIAPQIDLPVREKPVVMYGTSILQGGCATRPGMAHTNILERWLNREVYNFGFSGNARLDTEIADVMGHIDASLIVLDFLPNVKTAQCDTLFEAFYRTLRCLQPTTPILLVETPMFPSARFDTTSGPQLRSKNVSLRGFYDRFVGEGDKNLYYFDTSNLLCYDDEDTVDNAHFTDLGFQRLARKMFPVMQEIINNELNKK